MAQPDHFIILVQDIEKAVADYTTLGFTVQSRADSSAHGAAYRFVVFADGCYLLLTQFTSEEARAKHRLGADALEGEGFADWSLTIADVDAATRALSMADHPTRGPVEVSNVLQDGSPWGLKLLMSGKGAAGADTALPFLIEDTHGRAFRIPAYQPHANGLQRLSEIRLTSTDPAKTAETLALSIGATRIAQNEPVTLASPDCPPIVILDAAEVTPAGRARHGIYELVIETGHDSEGLLDLGLSHGARLITRKG